MPTRSKIPLTNFTYLVFFTAQTFTLFPDKRKSPEISNSFLCSEECQSCLETDSDYCTSCKKTEFLVKGACSSCDTQCFSSLHCTSSGCVKCNKGFYSAEIKGIPGTFKCYKINPLKELNIPAILVLVFTFVIYCGYSKLARANPEEEDVIYVAEKDKNNLPQFIDVRGKSDLNEYFKDKIWEEFHQN